MVERRPERDLRVQTPAAHEVTLRLLNCYIKFSVTKEQTTIMADDKQLVALYNFDLGLEICVTFEKCVITSRAPQSFAGGVRLVVVALF